MDFKSEQKKYILDNINKKSVKELAEDLGIRERKVKKFLEKQKIKIPPSSGINISLKPLYAFILLATIFTAALIIRLYPVIETPETFRDGFGPYGDTFLYHVIGYNLYQGNGFSGTDDGRAFGLSQEGTKLEYEPAITRGPVYPFFISLVYRILGSKKDMGSIQTWHKNLDKVRIVQCVLDALVCILLFLMVRAIYKKSILPALIVALLYCFSFYNIFYTRALLSESVTTFLLSASLLFCTLGLKHDKTYLWALAGAFFGLVILARTEYILFSLILALYLIFINHQHIVNAIKKSLVFIIAVSIVVIPWTARNYFIFRKLIPVSVGGVGYNLFLGTFEANKNWHGWNEMPDDVFDTKKEKAVAQSLYASFQKYMSAGSIKAKEFDDALMRLAFERIRKHPLECLKGWLIKIPRLWYQFYIPMYLYKEASGNFFIFYFVLALFALFKGVREEKILMAPICLLFVYLTFIFMPLHIEPRYGVPLMPGIICLASIGIWKIIDRGKKYN